MNNVMVDLETLGTRPGDAILSIGAVRFEAGKVDVDSTFYVEINQQHSKNAGFRGQKATVQWWSEQSLEAREVLRVTTIGGVSPKEALEKFAAWLKEDDLVWGNGANFDNALIAAAFRLVELPLPYKHWNDRCYRTLKGLFPEVPMPPRFGTHHNALDDAKTQAIHACQILAKIAAYKANLK